MVKMLLLVLLLPFYLLAADVKIDASIDLERVQEKQPLKGSIAITHHVNDKVDEKSFRLEGKPLSVERVQETKFAPTSPLVITFYRFTIDGKPKGLHILPAVQVKVGSHEYQSLPTTYEVGETAVPSNKPSKAQTGSSTVTSAGRILKLDAVIQAPAQLYPGQRIKVIYRYTFNDNIELTKEILPLLKGDGFVKVGTIETNDEDQGAVNVRELSQVLEAQKPGVFKFDESHIEGYVYRNDTFGQRIYLKPILQADAPTQTITVQAFPEAGKPASFNGAIGPFTHFEAGLTTPDHMNVGDKIILELTLTGSGQLEHAPLPELCCLPGFSGIFSQSDIPPKEEIKGPTKSFFVEMRPLTANVKAIPAIEYAYFDPKTKSYGTLKSKPIPIAVTALPPQAEKPQAKEEAAPPPEFSKTARPIEIYGNKPLEPSDMDDYFFGNWWVLTGIPLAAAALILQLFLRKYLRERKPTVVVKTSDLYLNEALKADPASHVFYQLLSKALIMRLVEKKKLSSSQLTLEQLPDGGVAGEVKALLMRIEEKRFTGQESVVDAKTIEEIKALYQRI